MAQDEGFCRLSAIGQDVDDAHREHAPHLDRVFARVDDEPVGFSANVVYANLVTQLERVIDAQLLLRDTPYLGRRAVLGHETADLARRGIARWPAIEQHDPLACAAQGEGTRESRGTAADARDIESLHAARACSPRT